MLDFGFWILDFGPDSYRDWILENDFRLNNQIRDHPQNPCHPCSY
jgi:hypothetical protein